MGREDRFALASGREHSANRVLAHVALESLTPADRLEACKKAFRAACDAYEDEAALELLDMIRGVFRELRKGNQYEEGFRSWLREVFFGLPDKQKVGTQWSDRERKQVPVYHSALSKTKREMLIHTLGGWSVNDPTGESVEAFRLLLAAFYPWSVDHLSKDADKWQKAAAGRMAFGEEQELIIELLKMRLGLIKESGGFGFFALGHTTVPQAFDYWLRIVPHSFVYQSFASVLLQGRLHYGGVCLGLRDVRNEKLLASFSPDDRSPAALDLFNRLSLEIVFLDKAVAELKETMQPPKYWVGDKDRQVGGSEYVVGELSFQFTSLTEVKVTLKLEEGCDEPLGRCIWGRARRHVEHWLAEHGGLKVHLEVSGVKPELCFNQTFKG